MGPKDQTEKLFYNHPELGIFEIQNLEPLGGENEDGLYKATDPEGAIRLISGARLLRSRPVEPEIEEVGYND